MPDDKNLQQPQPYNPLADLQPINSELVRAMLGERDMLIVQLQEKCRMQHQVITQLQNTLESLEGQIPGPKSIDKVKS